MLLILLFGAHLLASRSAADVVPKTEFWVNHIGDLCWKDQRRVEFHIWARFRTRGRRGRALFVSGCWIDVLIPSLLLVLRV